MVFRCKVAAVCIAKMARPGSTWSVPKRRFGDGIRSDSLGYSISEAGLGAFSLDSVVPNDSPKIEGFLFYPW
jgi:hypothetical protein